MQTYFLIGFMAAGKTTIGLELAVRKNLYFIDLDAEIEKQEEKTIAEIVTEKGIEYFRQKESKLLKELAIGNSVVATGGGTACFYDNLEWMHTKGKVVFIDTPFEIIFSRLKESDIAKRPLLKNIEPSKLHEQLHLLYYERLLFYRQATISFNPTVQKLIDIV